MILLECLVQLLGPPDRAPISASFVGLLEGGHILGSVHSIAEKAGNNYLGQFCKGETPLSGKAPALLLGFRRLFSSSDTFDLSADEGAQSVGSQETGEDGDQSNPKDSLTHLLLEPAVSDQGLV